MAYVYRYIDNSDGIIKYVGIVWSENRTLQQRIQEHNTYDKWCQGKQWKIEYITEDINTRTDAEYFEAHFVSLYGTDKYYNVSKSGWGISSFLPKEVDWITYEDNVDVNDGLEHIYRVLFYDYDCDDKKSKYKIDSVSAKKYRVSLIKMLKIEIVKNVEIISCT